MTKHPTGPRTPEPQTLTAAARWDRLKGSNGPAGEIGVLLRRLAYAKTRDEAMRITGALLGQSTHTCAAVTEASAAVAEVLASLLPDPDFAWKADVLSTLDSIRRAIRGGGASAARADRWLSEQLLAGRAPTRFRIARALLRHPGAGDEELLRRTVDETASPGMAAMWPAEL